MVGTSMPAQSYASTAVGAEGVQPLSSGESEVISDEEYGRAVQIVAGRISNPVEGFAMNEEGDYIDGKYLMIGSWAGLIQRKYFIPSDYIYMGVYNGTPIKWRVLDANKAWERVS